MEKSNDPASSDEFVAKCLSDLLRVEDVEPMSEDEAREVLLEAGIDPDAALAEIWHDVGMDQTPDAPGRAVDAPRPPSRRSERP